MIALPTIISYVCPVTGKIEEFRLVDFKLEKAIYQCALHGFQIMLSIEEARKRVGLE